MLNGKEINTSPQGHFSYHTPEALRQLSDEALGALYDAIPGEAADGLRRRYRSILKEKGVTGDAQELKIIDQYQDRYQYEGLVPVAKGWVKVSPSKRHAFIHETDETGEDEEACEPTDSGLPRPVLIVMFILGWYTRTTVRRDQYFRYSIFGNTECAVKNDYVKPYQGIIYGIAEYRTEGQNDRCFTANRCSRRPQSRGATRADVC